jgi:high-affinity nickel-transport protein
MTLRRLLCSRLTVIFAVLLFANVAVWCWALAAFHAYPILLGGALLAYSFGLRHAVDADHIAAIDNVARKLVQNGSNPDETGLYFSLGHSTVVVLASLGIAFGAGAVAAHFPQADTAGSLIGTIVSAVFLLAIAITNLFILSGVYRAFCRVKGGEEVQETDLHMLVARGPLSRLFRPLFRLINSPWQMYPLGFLFGLGFDTATEIGVLGISAAEAAKGLTVSSLLIFPALFTAGMALIDTLDSVLMSRAYGWAFLKPVRKLYYNLTLTALSVAIAFLVGLIEVLGLLAQSLSLRGSFWNAVTVLNSDFGMIGYLIIALFAAGWVLSLAVYRWKGYEALSAEVAG